MLQKCERLDDISPEREWWRSIPKWRDVDESLFCNGSWQERNAVPDLVRLQSVIGDLVDCDFYNDVAQGLAVAPMALRLSPYILSLIDWSQARSDPLRRQFLPLGSELEPDHPMLSVDSLGERTGSPVPGLTHRYPDRVLLLALDTCPVYCRFCTRSYAVGSDVNSLKKISLPARVSRWQEAYEYIRSHPSIEDVVVSGGDVYRLKPEQLTSIGQSLLELPNIRRFRFATKGLSVQPMKIFSDSEWTDALLAIARRGRASMVEVSVHTHFNHPNEITQYTRKAMKLLFQGGITVRNQCVLQRNVNNNVETMSELNANLARIHIHPYYVYMCDLVNGVENLRTPLYEALDLEKNIRGRISGFNTPLWVVDTAGGGGKRDIHSFESYDKQNGVATYRSPAVKPNESFYYFDPLASLNDQARDRWANPAFRSSTVHKKNVI